MSAEVTCARCGQSFAPPAHLLERYPGWRPRECPTCYRRGSGRGGGGAAPGRGARGDGGSSGRRARGSGGSPSTGGGASRNGDLEGALRLHEVLERYSGGPDTGVFTDGSASPNPGPGGWGAVWVIDGEIQAQDYGHEPHTTNNRMELTALHRGVELVPVGTPATVYSDSNLVVRTVTEWAAGWERRGWKRKTGPVENLDLVRPLYELLRQRPEIEVVWIRAHAGNRWNEYADALATAYARNEL